MQNFFLSCKEIRIEPTSPQTSYGCFYLGPFENGQSLTIANALRRTLLSEIPGLAITSIKIDGVLHEYSTLTGVRETVLDILLNFKEIVIKKNFREPILQTEMGYLQARGPGIIRAGDLKLPLNFQCVDPNQYIATLSENGHLNIQFTIDQGKNFIFLKNEASFLNLNNKLTSPNEQFLPIDAVFTPIKKVNYTIESYGAEAIDKSNQIIILEIWTNGGLSPYDAISQTLNYLQLLFNQLGQLKTLKGIVTTHFLTKNRKMRETLKKFDTNLTIEDFKFSKTQIFQNKIEEKTFKNLPTQIQKKVNDNFFNPINQTNLNIWKDQSVNNLGLPFRFIKSLYKVKIFTIGDILNYTSNELMQLLDFDFQSFSLLKENLGQKGLMLKS